MIERLGFARAGDWMLIGRVNGSRVLGLLGLFATGAVAENPLLEFARGVLAQSRGEPAAAAAAFEKALTLDPTAGPLVRRLARQRLAAGERAAAAGMMREWAAARPDDAAVQVEYADFLDEVGRGDALATRQAIDVLERALVLRPGDPQVVRRLFAQWRAAGKEDKALAVLEQLDPTDAEAAMVYGPLAASATDTEDVEGMARIEARYRQAFERQPDHAALARAAAEFFRKQGRLDEAIAVLTRHAEAAPWSLELRTRLGVLHFSAKDEPTGQRVLEEVLKISPRRVLAHQSLAKLHRMRGRTAEARFHAAELLKIRGGTAAEYVTLADEYLAAEDARAARLLLEKAAFEHPNSAAVLTKLAVASRRDPATRSHSARRFREAAAVISAGETADPAFLLESAEVMIEEGQSKAAEESLRAAIRSYPPEAKRETAAALRQMAALWEGENRNLEAAQGLRQRADALDPASK
jgi:tetratricopeptide (TPR) repeat protein